MVKMRVYEYAKQYNISSKEVISKLKELGHRGYKPYGNNRG